MMNEEFIHPYSIPGVFVSVDPNDIEEGKTYTFTITGEVERKAPKQDEAWDFMELKGAKYILAYCDVDSAVEVEQVFTPGKAYEDSNGEVWLRSANKYFPWTRVVNDTRNTTDSFSEHSPNRPLRELS